MTTGREKPARTQAIEQFLELSQNPHTPAMSAETLLRDEMQAKIRVYASLGVLVADILDTTLNDKLLNSLQAEESLMRLNNQFRKAMEQQASKTLENFPERAREVRAYARRRYYSNLVADHTACPAAHLIGAGVWTGRSTSSDLYDRLKASSHEPSRADIFDSYKLLDALAKLGIPAMQAYTSQYLNPGHSSGFSDHIEPSRRGSGFQFKPGAISNASIIWHEDDIYTIGDLMQRDKDSTIGCPITFRPDATKKLWQFYAQARFGCENTAAL